MLPPTGWILPATTGHEATLDFAQWHGERGRRDRPRTSVSLCARLPGSRRRHFCILHSGWRCQLSAPWTQGLNRWCLIFVIPCGDGPCLSVQTGPFKKAREVNFYTKMCLQVPVQHKSFEYWLENMEYWNIQKAFWSMWRTWIIKYLK